MKMFLALISALVFVSHAQAGKTNYQRAIDQVDAIVKANSDIMTWGDIGKNDQGDVIKMVKVAKANMKFQDKRLVVGAHHGNEVHSVDTAIQFLRDLAAEARNPKFADAIEHTYYVIPALNIVGYNSVQREAPNAKGEYFDPNRDYPDPCTNPAPFNLKFTKALADFIRKEQVSATITIHGYIGTFTYPWGTYSQDTHTPDHQLFDILGLSAVKENGYATGTSTDVIYPTVGAFEDWAYFEMGAWSMLLEIHSEQNLQNDSRAMLKFFSEVPNTPSLNHTSASKCNNLVRSEVRSRP